MLSHVHRHVDSILLCTIYAVCRVNELAQEVKFKHVIDHYKRKVVSANQVRLNFSSELFVTKAKKMDLLFFESDVYVLNYVSVRFGVRRITVSHREYIYIYIYIYVCVCVCIYNTCIRSHARTSR